MAKVKISKEEAMFKVGNCGGFGKTHHSNKCLKRCAETDGVCKTQNKRKNSK